MFLAATFAQHFVGNNLHPLYTQGREVESKGGAADRADVGDKMAEGTPKWPAVWMYRWNPEAFQKGVWPNKYKHFTSLPYASQHC